MRFPPGPRWLAAAAVLLAACTGQIDADDDDDWDDPDVPEEFVAQKGQIRLLSAHEYRNTIRDLLGVEASTELEFGDTSTGYDNAAGGELGESLFGVLLVEAERVADEYVEAGLAAAFPCFDPAAPLDPACAETIVTDLGRRAYRRPLADDVRQALVDFATATATVTDDPAEVMELVVIRMLMAPDFLYRVEIGTNLDDDRGLALLDPFERASLVSYSLTASMPDAELLAAAEADELDGPQLAEHVRRLLGTDAARAQLPRFFKEWLRLGDLDRMAGHPEDYAKLASGEQARALRDEFDAFIRAVVIDGEGTFGDLLTASVTFANQHTAPLYGATADGDALAELELDPAQRGGVLTLASVMAVHATAGEAPRDRPIQRGLLIKNQLLCEEVGFPSGLDLDQAREAVDGVENFDELTTREQLELVMEQEESCSGCHVQFMPIGYLWGNFDALGAFKADHGGRPIDAAVDALTIGGETRAYAGAMELVPALAASPQVHRCFTTQLAKFTSGFSSGGFVTFLAEHLATRFAESELRILTLIEETFATPELYLREGT